MFDFNSVYDRGKDFSGKWLKMYSEKPDVKGLVVPMSVADMDFPTSRAVVDGICEYVEKKVLGYTYPSDSYRKSVVKFMDEYHDFRIREEYIVTSPGIVPALATAVRAYTGEGDGVLMMTPVYPPFKKVVVNQKRKAVTCPMINRDNYYYIDFDLLEKLAGDSRNRLLLLCSPHNPGGRVWDMEELEKILHICRENNVLIVSDEIHSDIMLGEKKHVMFGSISGAGDISITCTAASKTFNIAGLQCSNIIIENEDLREKFEKANEMVAIGRANVLGMVATESAYENALDWLEAVKEVIKENFRVVDSFFSAYGERYKVMRPDASFLVWVDYRESGYGHDEFMEILKKSDFFINDGADFVEGGEGFIRINIGLPTEQLNKNLERLGKNI